MEFELKLQGGKVVTWEGRDGEDASVRYAYAHRDQTVVAWRHVRFGLFLGIKPIIEPAPGMPRRYSPQGRE